MKRLLIVLAGILVPFAAHAQDAYYSIGESDLLEISGGAKRTSRGR